MPGLFFLYPFDKGDVVTLRKAHPCGGKTWEIRRVGADISMSCVTCGHMMVVSRRTLEKSCTHVDPSKDTNKTL